jgi:hypothetical protein
MTLPTTITEDHIEPIQLPDVRRPEQMPSWPEWVASRIGSITIEPRPDKRTGRWRDVATLPVSLSLKAREREALERYVSDIEILCGRTPAVDQEAEQEMLVVLTEMMTTLPSPAQSEFSVEVRGAAFMAALDDLPPWALHSAIWRWNRGDCGTDHRGQLYNYHWCPAPAELRRVALAELARVKRRLHQAELLLRAECRKELDEQYCGDMRERFDELLRILKASSVG